MNAAPYSPFEVGRITRLTVAVPHVWMNTSEHQAHVRHMGPKATCAQARAALHPPSPIHPTFARTMCRSSAALHCRRQHQRSRGGAAPAPTQVSACFVLARVCALGVCAPDVRVVCFVDMLSVVCVCVCVLGGCVLARCVCVCTCMCMCMCVLGGCVLARCVCVCGGWTTPTLALL